MPNEPELARTEMLRLVRQGSTRDPDWFRFDDTTLDPAEVIALLDPFVTDERKARLDAVLDERTYNLTVVVDGMVDTGNVAAVMRTADGMGIQEFHTIDTAGSYKHSRRTAQGAHKWLDRYRWRDTAACLAHLENSGYRTVVAHLDASAAPIDQVDFSKRTALVFGNELAGVSDEVLAGASEVAFIPISGFVQSYNISVAAGVGLYVARQDRVSRLGGHGDLGDEDRRRLMAVFMMKSVKRHRELIGRLLGDEGPAG